MFVAISLPRLSLEVFRPRWSLPTEHGCVVLERDKVVVMDSMAREAGVLPGMKWGGITTLSPNALMYDRSVEREQEMQREVAFGLPRFSPQVAVCDEETIVLDVTASLRLFGGIQRVCALMREVVKAVGVSARMSVAPTGQGSWLLAKRGRCRVLKMSSLERNLRSYADVRIFVPSCGLPSAKAPVYLTLVAECARAAYGRRLIAAAKDCLSGKEFPPGVARLEAQIFTCRLSCHP